MLYLTAGKWIPVHCHLYQVFSQAPIPLSTGWEIIDAGGQFRLGWVLAYWAAWPHHVFGSVVELIL